MKKRYFLLLLVLILSVISSAHADYMEPVGTAEDLFGRIAVYCNNWQRLVGDTFGFDISYDPDNITMTRSEYASYGGIMVTSFDCDGIIADVDDDLNVYDLFIPIDSDSKKQYAGIGRVLAVIAANGYDFPDSDDDMTTMFMALFTKYLDALETGENDLVENGIAFWTVETEKKGMEFYFTRIDGKLYFSYNKITFE